MNIRNLLVEALRTFSTGELTRFDKFLCSPYFIRQHFNNSKVYELFKMLKSYFLRLPDPKASATRVPIVNWERITNKLFPAVSSAGKQKRLGKVCSELITYVLDFIAVDSYQSRKVDVRISIASELLRRNLSSLFERHWKVKYFSGIYSEDEVSNIYHRYTLIRVANVHKERSGESRPDYELELMLFRKNQEKALSELSKRAEISGYKLSC